jgi:hypothetical protein
MLSLAYLADMPWKAYFAFFFLNMRPAFRIAIAIACLCGRPACISVLMFSETTLSLDPDFSGMISPAVTR